MVSGENPSVCSDLKIFNDTTTAISNLYLPYLAELRKKYSDNPIIGYLNVISLRYKVVDLRHVLFESELDIPAISELNYVMNFLILSLSLKAITILHILGRIELHMVED